MQNIIFDWTGVIKDALEDHVSVINFMFEDFGIKPISTEELRETWKQPFMDFYNMHLPNLTMEEQKKVYFKAYAKVKASGPYPKMVPLLKRLYFLNKKMVILSSDSPNSILQEIKDFGLEEIFDDMELEVHDKVNHIADLMTKNAMESNDTIIVGDTNNEIDAARSVGIKVVSVTWGLCSEKNLKQHSPDYIVNTVEELAKILV